MGHGAGKAQAKAKATKPRRARGTGAVFYSESRGAWVGRKLVAGVRREVTGRTQAAVVAKVAALGPAGDRTTVKEWVARWLDSSGLRAGTLLSRGSYAKNYVVPTLGHVRVAALTAYQCEEAALAWRKAGLAAGTVREVFSQLRTCLQAAVRHGLRPDNPARAARKPRPDPKARAAVLAPAELLALVRRAEADARGRAAALLATAGLRVGEALALDVPDFDPAAGTVAVTKTRQYAAVGPPKTRGSVRTIRVPAAALPALRAARGTRSSGALFLQESGDRLTPHVLRRWLAGVAPGVNPHALRHAVATHLVARGRNLADVARYLGHSLQVLLATYAHPGAGDVAAALDEVFAGP